MITKRDITRLQGLLYFYAISQAKSKREVAEKLGVSVDTINKYIDDLQNGFKNYFVASNERGSVITPLGKQILELANEVVRVVRNLDQYIDVSDSSKGVVRMWMADAISDYLGVESLFDFFEEFPNVRLESRVNGRIPNISKMETDICLSYEMPQGSNLVLVASKQVRCGLFASRGYIEKYGKPKDRKDLIENHRICSKVEHERYTESWREIVMQAKHVVYTTNSVHSLRRALTAGFGVAICPYMYASEELIPLKEVNFDFDINLYLLAHKETKNLKRIRAVLDRLTTLLESRPG